LDYSTGGYLAFIQGSIVDAASFLPQLILLSSAEAEYMTSAHYMLTGSLLQRMHLESLGNKYLIAMSESHGDTKQTCHITHWYHLACSKVNSQKHLPLKIPGETNSSGSMTNNLSAFTLDSHIHIHQVNVPPLMQS
jgi:hypothetical protein